MIVIKQSRVDWIMLVELGSYGDNSSDSMQVNGNMCQNKLVNLT